MTTTTPRILCVDDEPEILRFLEALLLPKGYEVIKAKDGEEALEKLREQRVDLVISDVKMPKIDGLELCRRIKEDERYRSIPVVIITAFSAMEDRIKGIEAGAEDFISKPFDSVEVLARIRMLLKAKAHQERRIGELLIQMGFITEEQLQKALKFAKEQNIKVGEALYSMGALDKDHIYWVLSDQMNMNYVELSPEMIDRDLMTQFSMGILEELKCLPLHETMREIHFAIADPTDHQAIKKVKSLRPGKDVQLHLALPEKIMDILNFFREEFYPDRELRKIAETETKGDQPPSIATVERHEILEEEYCWSNFVTVLLSMPQNEIYWFNRTPGECRLMSQKGGKFEVLSGYPEEAYILIKKQLKQKMTSHNFGGVLFIQEKSTGRQGAFNLWEVGYLDSDMIRIEQIQTFSQKEFMLSYPEISRLMKDLQDLLSMNRCVLIGGRDKLFVKQCCYSLLKEGDHLSDFPPPFFVERQIETYFPKAAQLSVRQCNSIDFLNQFRETPMPFLFYEAELPEITSDEANLSKISSSKCRNIILYCPFHSFEEMKEALSIRQDWHQEAFKAVFFSPDGLKSI